MAHINMYTVLILVVLASGMSGRSIPRLSDLQQTAAASSSKIIYLKQTQEYLKNPIEHLGEAQNKEDLSDQYIKLLKQFIVLPNKENENAEIGNEINESLKSYQEIKVDKRHNEDETEILENDEVEETENEEEKVKKSEDGEPENLKLPADKQKRHNDEDNVTLEDQEYENEILEDVEDNIENKRQTDEVNDDENVSDDDDDDDKDSEDDEIFQNENKSKRQSGDELIEENNEISEDETTSEKVDIEKKKIKRQNDDENEDLKETKNYEESDNDNTVEKRISAMFVNRFNKMTI